MSDGQHKTKCVAIRVNYLNIIGVCLIQACFRFYIFKADTSGIQSENATDFIL